LAQSPYPSDLTFNITKYRTSRPTSRGLTSSFGFFFDAYRRLALVLSCLGRISKPVAFGGFGRTIVSGLLFSISVASIWQIHDLRGNGVRGAILAF
jgi:hypothetical protein